MEGSGDIDLNADVGTKYALTDVSTVTIIDPFEEYVDTLKACFDFNSLKKFASPPDFSILFDGMHGAGGPFARRVLVEELGLPEVCALQSSFACVHLHAILSHNTTCAFYSLRYCVVIRDLTLENVIQTRTLHMLPIL